MDHKVRGSTASGKERSMTGYARRNPTTSRTFAVVLTTTVLVFVWLGVTRAAAPISDTPPPARQEELSAEVAALKAEIERLKGIVPDQSHAMKDVAYHFANLWFAAQKKNWPLAEFYWAETRSHLRWAVRILPVRKDPQGNEVRLATILEPIEKTALQQVHEAIQAQDSAMFARVYQQMLESCYACHLAAGKPFLRLQIPQQPEVPIIRFDPEP
jgi:hypothetical protein